MAADVSEPHAADPSPYDAVLLVSFGGPERPEEVVPFLENVTRGRNIPRERLAEVGQHYFLFGGKSPINDLNRAFVHAIEEDFAQVGLELPVYWGNRNWDPFLADTLREMAADGVTRAACFLTSAYSSYSSCRQYREDLAVAADAVPEAPRLDRLRGYYNHPGFVAALVDGILAAVAELPADVRRDARLVFVTHSIPTAMNDTSGPWGGAYLHQHQSIVRVVADQARRATGYLLPSDLAFCSRSGAPHVPWLGPDVNDHLRAIAPQTRAVVLVPVGFVADHMEVIYDLDTEALATADELGLPAVRSATAGLDTRFVAVVRDLVLERAAAERGLQPQRQHVGGLMPPPDLCAQQCCPNPRGERAAIGGVL